VDPSSHGLVGYSKYELAGYVVGQYADFDGLARDGIYVLVSAGSLCNER
jgi:hypothetical protein